MLTFSSQIFPTCIMLCLTSSTQKFVCSTTRGNKYGDQEHYKKITDDHALLLYSIQKKFLTNSINDPYKYHES